MTKTPASLSGGPLPACLVGESDFEAGCRHDAFAWRISFTHETSSRGSKQHTSRESNSPMRQAPGGLSEEKVGSRQLADHPWAHRVPDGNRRRHESLLCLSDMYFSVTAVGSPTSDFYVT